MANSLFQLNYDELESIAKKFKDEGEDMARLHSTTHQRVRDLHKEWIGEAAEKFFDEMETELLPAVQRLAQALFLSQDVTNDIMKIIQGADEETAGYFRNQLSGDDFGAGMFGQALEGLPGGAPGADDFGAGKFGEALGTPVSSGGSSASDDFGAGKFGEALDHSSSSSDQGDSVSQGETDSTQGRDKGSQKSAKDQPTETEPSSTGSGGGGSSSSSQGLQGDLKKMGVGLGEVAPQHASSGSGGPVKMPDHVYSDGDSPKPEGPEPKPDSSKPGVDTGSSDSQQSSSGGGAAAGVAGVAGAAAAGKAAKTVKKQQKGNG